MLSRRGQLQQYVGGNKGIQWKHLLTAVLWTLRRAVCRICARAYVVTTVQIIRIVAQGSR